MGAGGGGVGVELGQGWEQSFLLSLELFMTGALVLDLSPIKFWICTSRGQGANSSGILLSPAHERS